MLKAFVVRIALLGLASAMVWNTIDYTKDQSKWFLYLFLITQLFDFVTFIWEVVDSGCDLEDEGKSLKICLLLFLFSICPAICVMEHHRMQELYMIYGRWDCVTNDWGLPGRVKSNANGMVNLWTCIRTRPIIQCFHPEHYTDFPKQMLQIIILQFEEFHNYIFQPDHKGVNPDWKNDPNYKNLKFTSDYSEEQKRYMAPSFGNYTTLFCRNVPYDRTARILDAEKNVIDEKNNYVRFCYNKTVYWNTEWCYENMDRCKVDNVTAPYLPMKIRCRLVECVPFLCATVVSWLLISSDPDCQQLTISFLRNFLCASDIFQLFESFDEPIGSTPNSWNRILYVWPICLLHLFFINVMSSDENISPDSESASTSASESPTPSDTESPQSPAQEDLNQNNLFLEAMIVNIDMWAVILTGILFDGLLLYLRHNLLSTIDVFEPQIHFFMIKNFVFILAQLFRAIILCQPSSYNV